MLTVEQGKKLIYVVREVIKTKLNDKSYSVPSSIKKMFSFKSGCFVTLKKGNSLRGCIGYTESNLPLIDTLMSAAEKAAFADPRFPPLDKDELKYISIEVSVLTRPRLIMVRNPEDYLKEIKVGKDGLIVKGVLESGLLLPQVAIEYEWNAQQFLEQTCVKAGLQKDDWRDFNKVTVYKFQSQVFSESSPNGPVEIVVQN